MDRGAVCLFCFILDVRHITGFLQRPGTCWLLCSLTYHPLSCVKVQGPIKSPMSCTLCSPGFVCLSPLGRSLFCLWLCFSCSINSVVLTYFSHCCDEMLDKKQTREEGLNWLKVCRIDAEYQGGGAWRQGCMEQRQGSSLGGRGARRQGSTEAGLHGGRGARRQGCKCVSIPHSIPHSILHSIPPKLTKHLIQYHGDCRTQHHQCRRSLHRTPHPKQQNVPAFPDTTEHTHTP